LFCGAWFWAGVRVAGSEIKSRAEKHFWSGNLPEARRQYELLSRIGPFAKEGRRGLLDTCLGTLDTSGRPANRSTLPFEEAGRGCGRIAARQVEESPLSAETWMGIADLYGALKIENQKKRVYSLEEFSRPAESRLEREDLLQIRSMETALGLDPNGIYARDVLADLAWSLGLFDLARAQYGELMTLEPDPYSHPFLAAGKVSQYLEKAVVEGMERALRPPRDARPEVVYRNLGSFYLQQERFADAIKAFENAERVSGRSYAQWRAYASTRMGDLKAAIPIYRNALAADPLTPEERFHVLLSLGDLLETVGSRQEASEALRAALVLQSRNPQAVLLLGRVTEEMGLWDEAEELFVKGSEIGTDRISGLANLVAFYRRSGKPSLALQPARELIKANPGEPVYRKQLEDIEAEIDAAER
jgi:tetratricopeptide (TPR) repeat protein